MTVYGIWAGAGAYEDYTEELIDLYAEKSDAEAAFCDLVMQERQRVKQAEKCVKCPSLMGRCVAANYCVHFEEVTEYRHDYFDCEYFDGDCAKTSYWIKAYEVK